MVICGSLWAEMVFLTDEWVFNRNEGEAVKYEKYEVAGVKYDSVLIEVDGKYKFRMMLEEEDMYFSKANGRPRTYDYGLPKTWPTRYVIVIYYFEQKTSLVEYTEGVKGRLKKLI